MLLFNYYFLLLKESIFSLDPAVLKTTLLYFYSTLAQSMAALFAVSGIFLIFRLEAIKSEISRGIDNFRNWVDYRMESGDPLIRELNVSWEPNSWLEKDVLYHVDEALRRAKEKNHTYTRALVDYFQFIHSRIKYQERIKILATVPFVLISYIFLNSIYNMAIIDLLVCKYRIDLYRDIVSLLNFTFFTTIYLVLFIIYTILEPRSLIINTPKNLP